MTLIRLMQFWSAKRRIPSFMPTSALPPAPTTLASSLATLILAALITLLTCSGCSESPEHRYQKLSQKYHEYRGAGKDAEARLTLLGMIDLKPEDPELYRELADLLLRNHQLREAVGTYRSVLNLLPDDFEARFRIASILLAASQPELAEDHVYKLLDSKRDDTRVRLLLALLRRQQKNLSEASKILAELEKQHPEDPEVLGSLAFLALDNGDREQAERYLVRAIAKDPKNISFRLSLAQVFASQGRLDEAQELLSGALSESPEDAGMRYFYAEFLFGRGIRESAEQEFRKVIETNPQQHLARDRLYDLYLIRRDKKAANALTEALIKLSPTDAGSDYFRARDLELDGRYDQALPLLLKSIEGLPNFSPAFRRAGLIELRSGERSAGLEHLRQAIGLNEYDVAARLALAKDAFLQKQFGMAMSHVNKILEKFPTQLAAHVMKADLALVQGNLEEARRVYSFLAEKRPDNTLGALKMGLLEERSGNFDKALEHYEKALVFDPNSLIPARRAVRIVVAKDGIEAGLRYLKTVAETIPGSKPVLDYLQAALMMAREYPSKSDLTTAKQLLTAALTENKNLLPAYALLARINFVDHDYASVISNYELWLKKAPQDVLAMIQLGMTYEAVGRKADARTSYKRALQLEPENAIAANNLSWLLIDGPQANLDEAERLAKLAKGQQPKDAGVTDTLSWIYYKRGQIKLALSIAEEAQELLKATADSNSDNSEVDAKTILSHLEIIRQANSTAREGNNENGNEKNEQQSKKQIN